MYSADSLHYYQEKESLTYSERYLEAMKIIREIRTIKRYPQWHHQRWIYKATTQQLELDFKRVTGDTIVL
ncbi:MAG: hypothetical protein WCJ33_09295, partial [Pseudomonadota bacterium]